MIQKVMISTAFLLVTNSVFAAGIPAPSEFAENFVDIFDLNHSDKLEKEELDNAYQVTSFGQLLNQCAGDQLDSKAKTALWYYLMEKGNLPKTPTDKIKFMMYAGQNHDQISVDSGAVDRGLVALTTACRR